ncbi:2-acylglycerol O-acyltransferase 3-like protein [Dinothrombium tinctorium]|uniref:Acyltransferase n=1 Tax=Dinothrombium tinctorium TaxID=1965070 RepID=A0A3S3SNH5_9ACAR|nr:2-acylglycerol O-acyltransferase 3-like protein [Dinothrombium tinctorium]
MFRNSLLFRLMAEYFPAKLHKTAELDPKKNYILGYHPHGVLSLGASLHFSTNSTGFDEHFPGIRPRTVTLNINFWLPFHRDYFLSNGAISADKESIEWMLRNNGTGNAVVIVVGGAAESLDAIPNTMELTLKNRKGFVKLALENGASLVPCISFGENEIFIQTPHSENSIFKRIQKFIRSITTFSMPLFHGRGIFQYNFGILPYRKPINTVGGRQLNCLRRCILYRYVADYFPIKLHKTAELSPDKNYIIGYHPHGILGVGSILNFATDATGFDKKFPDINRRVVTLNINFLIPFHREYVLSLGCISADKKSIEWMLRNNGTGNAVVIVVGGAAESLDAVPNTMQLTLKYRKGFVKIALENGASLVPCVSFGENELFSQLANSDNSMYKKVQRYIRSVTTFALPVFYGRGIFQYNIGFLPYRKSINTVVGKPIDVEKIENPTEEDINKLHDLYVKSLIDLFYAHRSKYAINKEMRIVIK